MAARRNTTNITELPSKKNVSTIHALSLTNFLSGLSEPFIHGEIPKLIFSTEELVATSQIKLIIG